MSISVLSNGSPPPPYPLPGLFWIYSGFPFLCSSRSRGDKPRGRAVFQNCEWHNEKTAAKNLETSDGFWPIRMTTAALNMKCNWYAVGAFFIVIRLANEFSSAHLLISELSGHSQILCDRKDKISGCSLILLFTGFLLSSWVNGIPDIYSPPWLSTLLLHIADLVSNIHVACRKISFLFCFVLFHVVFLRVVMG